MIWYNYLGGKKAYLGLVGLIAGIVVWYSVTMETRAANMIQMFLFILACVGIYAYGNLKEKQIKNGKEKPEGGDHA